MQPFWLLFGVAIFLQFAEKIPIATVPYHTTFHIITFLDFEHYDLPKSYQTIRLGYFSMPKQLSINLQQECFRSAVNTDTLMGPASTHQTVSLKLP